jgi:hypothetical protein
VFSQTAKLTEYPESKGRIGLLSALLESGAGATGRFLGPTLFSLFAYIKSVPGVIMCCLHSNHVQQVCDTSNPAHYKYQGCEINQINTVLAFMASLSFAVLLLNVFYAVQQYRNNHSKKSKEKREVKKGLLSRLEEE